MRENVLPILEDASVDLVLNGDCGSYERSFLIEGHSGSSVTLEPQTMLVDGGDGSIDGNGEYRTSVIDRPIRDAVVGSSGETQVGSLDYPVIYVSLKTLGSMALNVNGPLLDAVFLDNTGQIRDRFRMVKTTDTAKVSTSAPDAPTTEVNRTPQTITVSPTRGTVGDAAGNISSRSSIVGAATQAVSSTSNLVAHWTLYTQNVDPSQSSAEVRDVSGSNNHADLKNRSATTVPGKLRQALATTQGALPTTSLSITSYGATGNDTTDDTTAINNTINAAKAQGKSVYLPAGTFYHKEFSLDGVSMTGAGNTTSILYAFDAVNNMIVVKGSGVTLSNLQVKSAKTTRSDVDHPLWVEGTNFTIDGIVVEGGNSASLFVYGGSNGKIINSTVGGGLADAIQMTNGSHDIVVANNVVRRAQDDSIAAVSYSSSAIVRNILIQGNDVAEATVRGRGISCVGSSDITIQDNTIGTSPDAGILVATEPAFTSPPVSNVLIRNNQLSNNGTGVTEHSALLLSALNGNINRVRLEGNTITQPVNQSIRLGGTNSNVAVINATMTDTQANGIQINSGQVNVFCSGNTMNGSPATHPNCTGVNNFTVTGSSLTY